MSPWGKFPSFESTFAKSEAAGVGLYQTLSQPSPHAGLAIADIKRCVQRSGPNLTSELREMLAQPNWRPQLVAAVTLLVAGATSDQLEMLWGAIGRPSYISPQLAASASILDQRFAERARVMIEHRCLFDEKDMPVTDWRERHHALGPASYYRHATITLSALVALSSQEGEPAWLKLLPSASDIRTMLADGAEGKYAVQWIAGITPLLG